ncbi:MAG: adenylate/guanylate cyclase domain-containing protein [Desulfobacteraceae bacterium]|jgi:adenylate cyclase
MKLNIASLRKGIHNIFSRLRRSKITRDDLFIGEVLKRSGIITELQLKTALDHQRQTLLKQGRAVKLGRIIVDLGYAPEADIIRAINAEYQIEITSLSDDIRDLLARKYGTQFERLPQARIPMWIQLAVATTFVSVITVITLSLAVLDKQKERLYDQTVRMGMVSLNYFANNAKFPLLEEDILRLNTLIKEASGVEGLRYALITDTNDKIKAHTDVNLIGLPFKHFVDKPNLIRKGDVIYYTYRQAGGARMLDLYRSINLKNKNLGQVHVGISLDFIEQLVIEERVSVVLVTLGVILIGLVVAVLYGFRFSKPISQIVKATDEIGRGNYQYRVPLKRNDELGNLAIAFNRMGQELWKNAMTQKSFGKYVGTEVLDLILANPETDWLKGTRNDATIIFGDVRGFTSYATEKAPEEVVEALNAYLEIATTHIINFGGYIDKFIGDAVMGVFGVPVFRKDHVERAVRAAVKIQQELHKESLHGNPLLAAVGISIHTGVVVAGNVGSQSKMEYTVIGDSVNVTARLNALAGPGEVVVSRQVKETLDEMMTTQSLGPQKIKGKIEPVEAFKVLRMQLKSHGTQ